MVFSGFPTAAFDFYDDLEVNNTKAFWESNKAIYQQAILGPITELTDALAPAYGKAKIFRPHRDVRFAADKSPYKTAQGAYVAGGGCGGWYIQISAAGVLVGGGFHGGTSEQITAFRSAVNDDRRGTELAGIITDATAEGFALEGESLKTAPRGFTIDHPRIDLLRHKSLTLGKKYGFDPVVSTPELLDVVRSDWEQMRPFIEWLGREVA